MLACACSTVSCEDPEVLPVAGFCGVSTNRGALDPEPFLSTGSGTLWPVRMCKEVTLHHRRESIHVQSAGHDR